MMVLDEGLEDWETGELYSSYLFFEKSGKEKKRPIAKRNIVGIWERRYLNVDNDGGVMLCWDVQSIRVRNETTVIGVSPRYT